MQTKKRKLISIQMVGFELRNVIGNPYVHIFGIGLPVVLAMLITRMVVSEIPNEMAATAAATSVYLGAAAMIPMAVLLMGYAVGYAEEMARGVQERMQLFGISSRMTFCNRAVAELFFLIVAFGLFFGSGCMFFQLKRPTAAGLFCYIFCMIVFSMICMALAHGVACLCRNFGKTYCVGMLIYFSFLILGGMMGLSYEDLPGWAQAAAKLLPVTYINRDFYQIWTGKTYQFMPMVQSYLFLGAVALLVLCVPDVVRTLRRK